MSIQHWLMLALIVAAAAYMARGLFKSACGTGCTACKSKGCPSRNLAALRPKPEDSRA